MRQPKPFFRSQNQTWYVQFGKQQIPLSRDEQEAWQKYYELMAGRREIRPNASVHLLLDAFLRWCQRNRSQGTYDWYRRYVSSFARSVKKNLTVFQVKPSHITAWLDAHPEWSQTTKYDVVRAVQRAFNWAVKEGHIDRSPVIGVEKPRPQRREVVFTTEELETIFSDATDSHFLDLITVIWETGCRPQEAWLVEKRHVDLETGRWVFPPSENKDRRFPRVIYLTEKAQEITARWCTKCPEGPIFRNRRGTPWNKNSMNCRFRRMRERLGIEKLCAYAIRHSYATEALKNGVDPITLAVIMGHADTTMIARTYQHLAKHPDFLRQAVCRAKGRDA